MSRTPAAILAVALLGPSACEREALPNVCPNVDAGQLVISELRGDQADEDSFGHYIEIYNAAGKTVDLQGLRLYLRSKGGDELTLFVRDSIEVQNRGYAVIGPGLEDDKQKFIDYPVGWDISGGDPSTNTYPIDLLRYGAAFVEIEACGELIDRVYYDALPDQGTLACGNATNPPSADDNDDSESGCWCVDAMDADGQPLFGLGLPGSPGAANRCP